MVPLSQLWMPLLLSTVAVFLASSVIHMASPWHKNDYPKLPNEDAVMDALRPLGLAPGDYMFPRPQSMAEMKTPEFLERVNRGPKVIMTVMPNGMTPMGGMFVQWTVYILVVTTIAALLAWRSVGGDAPGAYVFHQVFLAAFAGYGLALFQLSIWYARSWSITIKSAIDGAIYAAITAAIFQWCW